MQFVVNILSLSSFYISFSLGLALIFGVLRIVNYAHGELYMVGGYALYVIVLALAGHASPVIVMVSALLVAGFVGSFAGFLLQASIFQPLKTRPFSIFMASLGVSYIVRSLVVLFIGASGRSISPIFPGFVRIGAAIVPYQRLVVFGGTLLMVVSLHVFLKHTRYGRMIRAAAMNEKGALLQGINLNRINAVTAVLGAALASVSGTLMASVVSINPYMGAEAIWRAFIIIIVGGIGSIPGAILAAALFATFDTSLLYAGLGKLSALADACIMLLVLTIRPQGLLGVKD